MGRTWVSLASLFENFYVEFPIPAVSPAAPDERPTGERILTTGEGFVKLLFDPRQRLMGDDAKVAIEMQKTRRGALRSAVAVLAWIAGCLDVGGGTSTPSDGPSTESPDEGDTSTDLHSVTDVWVDNETDDRRSVSLTATTGGETVLEEQMELSPDGTDRDTVTFEDPFADDTAYELVVDTSGLAPAEYEWDGEFDDNGGVQILVKQTEIEFLKVQH